MIELDDCGRELHLTFGTRITNRADVSISMIIKASRGTLVLFESDQTLKKCEAIKAFMKEHNNE